MACVFEHFAERAPNIHRRPAAAFEAPRVTIEGVREVPQGVGVGCDDGGGGSVAIVVPRRKQRHQPCSRLQQRVTVRKQLGFLHVVHHRAHDCVIVVLRDLLPCPWHRRIRHGAAVEVETEVLVFARAMTSGQNYSKYFTTDNCDGEAWPTASVCVRLTLHGPCTGATGHDVRPPTVAVCVRFALC